MSKKMFSRERERERERERGKLRFSALLILIGLLLFGCDPTMVTITYNPNGGEGEMKPQAVESGFEVKLNANTFTKDGSNFTGWNEAADGSGKAYADGATVAPTENLTLYAQWQAKSTPENPGTEDPGTENPGTEDPDPENPGTEDPESPVVLEDHITNLALIRVVEETYKLKNDNAEIGWTKTAEGYVDMTIAKNQELVAGVTSLGSDGDMSLDGIEYFTGLQVLILENNRVLTKLPDLTSLNSLRSLSVTSSSLTAVSDLPVSLETLNLNTNKLTTLNVSELTNLTYLDVSVNELTELDVDTNTKLTYLACFTNRMNELDITNVEAFSQDATEELTPILACGMQEDANGALQRLTLIGTQAQKTALALLIPDPNTALEAVTELQKPNIGVVWDVPKAELELTEGTAVFNATSGLKLSFTVVNTGALTQEELTQLLANATKKVTLFTADNETGTPVETGISHGVDGSTPYISVEAAAFPQESTTYSKIEVVLEAEGYETQTLTYTDVSVNVPKKELGITKGTAVFNKTTGLALSFSGSTLPVDASASVSLNGTQVDSTHVSISGNAVIVALAGLTNGASNMEVTVTVSAAGYNDAVLPYEGVSTVWIPDGVTATFDDTEKIGGESVSVTISPELSGVTISGTYSVDGVDGSTKLTIGADGLSFTAPILPDTVAAETGTQVTISLVLAKENAESVPVSSTLKVYPETHVRFDGKFYALAQGFNFTDVSTLDNVKDGENPIGSLSDEGYVFSIPSGNEKKSLNFSLIDSEKIVLTMIEAKWDRNNCANIFVAGLDATGKAAYGWSPFKGNYSFMLGEAASGADSGQRWNSKNDNVRLSVIPAENTFNKYFVFDNGEGNATLGFNDRVKLTTVAITSKADTTINRISSISSNKAWPLTFQHANGDDKTNSVTYTLRTVNFYKAIQ